MLTIQDRRHLYGMLLILMNVGFLSSCNNAVTADHETFIRPTILCRVLLGTGRRISGMVFNDANGNGIRDTRRNRNEGVAVSDQVNVVITDANGFITCPTRRVWLCFITQPNGFKAQRSYFQKVDLGLSAVHVDFALAKVNTPTQFKFIHASDTHISEKSSGSNCQVSRGDRQRKTRFCIGHRGSGKRCLAGG